MNAKTFLTFLTISALTAFNAGCTEKIVYVPKEVLVPVAVGCKAAEPVCDGSMATYTEIVTEARLCVRRYRAALDYCR